MLLEYGDIISEGKRKFSVCKHHSIYFDTFFGHDKPSYKWYCSSDKKGSHRNIPKLVNLPSLRITYLQNHSPFIFE